MNRLKNVALSLAALLLLYIVLETFALVLFAYLLPPVASPLLDDGVPVILQSSKQSIKPEHYIALTGDSYAMGLGDTYYHAAGTARARYGSAPLIYDKTGKDVISFGSAGNGSIAGMVTEPLSTLAYWRSSWRIVIDDPETLLVYFYEGNDLNDNVEYLQQASKKRKPFEDAQLHNSDYFQNYIQEVALNQDPLYQQAKHLHWYDQLYLGKFIIRSSAILIQQVPNLFHSHKKAESISHRSPLNPPGRFEWTELHTIDHTFINHALINGNNQPLPDKLQGPSMDLTESEKHVALISFHESLSFLKKHLPNTKITIIYVPSVIACYDITSKQVSLQSHARRQQFMFDATAVNQQSNWIAQQIRQISAEEKVAFIDTRPAIRQAGKTRLLHGPLDWNHFNQQGYEALVAALSLP